MALARSSWSTKKGCGASSRETISRRPRPSSCRKLTARCAVLDSICVADRVARCCARPVRLGRTPMLRGSLLSDLKLHAGVYPKKNMNCEDMMNKKPFVIVVGVDYAELSDAALARAFEHAEREEAAEVHVVS